MNRNGYFVSTGGGKLSFVDDEGEVLLSVALPPGKVHVAEYLDVDPGNAVWVLDGVTYVPPRVLGGRMPYGVGATESGANPDYQPTSATRLELEMREQIKQAQVLNRTVAARLAALNSMAAMPVAAESVQVKEVPLVE